MTTQELEARLHALEQVVLRAAAAGGGRQSLMPAIIEASPAKPKMPTNPKAPAKPRKPKAKARQAAQAAPPRTPDIAPQPRMQLQVLEGNLEPVGHVLKRLKATIKSVEGIEPLMTLDAAIERKALPNKTGCNAHNLKRVWSTLVHFRATDDDGFDQEQLRSDLADFKVWCRDPSFLAAINSGAPQTAVCWFVDTLLAANGDLGDED